ncbi:MAG: phosphoserine aminotransferase, partial [Dinoroseobacter sp.]|nr:phosphoserine aminotransferase [Dinoroseobacter sp.]
MTAEPALKPERPFFSSGPTVKHKGWSAANLKTESLGRSHRSALGKSRLKHAIDLSKEMLGVPEDYLVGIMPASDTGALECAMWTMLRPDRPATVAAWESFGNVWIQDAVKQLKLPQLTVMDADYGEIPDLASIPQDNDVVFTW